MLGFAATLAHRFAARPAARRSCAQPRTVSVSAFLEQSKKSVQPPVIDAEGFLHIDRDHQLPPSNVALQLAQAGSEFGCFQIINTGLSKKLEDALQREMRNFFDLPLEEKLKVKRTATNPNGFANDELTKQTRDLKEIFDFCHEIDASMPGFVSNNQWLEGQGEFRRVMEAYLAEMSRISFKLLQAFCVGLELPSDTLRPTFEGAHTSYMRLNYYPAIPAKEKGLGLNHHTDAGVLTILKQDPEVHGLEFLADGQWHTVTPAPDALTINVGDQAQVLTNDIFKAPVHRVQSPHNRARYSAPFFFNPRPDAVIAPLPAFVTAERPAVYRSIPWREFRELRIAGDYADLGEEIQISHYRL